jgi:DNA-binding MarR family transcriptional regulator
MESLADQGPQTVPALARARPVARQHIQVLVNDLVRFGLVETRPNAAHKRSPLFALTARGAAWFQAIRSTELEALRSMRLSLSAAQMAEIAGDLGTLSDDLSRWLAGRGSDD